MLSGCFCEIESPNLWSGLGSIGRSLRVRPGRRDRRMGLRGIRGVLSDSFIPCEVAARFALLVFLVICAVDSVGWSLQPSVELRLEGKFVAEIMMDPPHPNRFCLCIERSVELL